MFVATSILAAALLPAPAAARFPAGRPLRISCETLTEMLDLPARRVYFGGMMIEARDTVSGPVVVVRGSLDMQDGAAIRGDAWVVNGRLIMTGASAIEGTVHLVSSEEYLSHDAVIAGGVRRYECACRLDDARFEREETVAFRPVVDPRAVRTGIGYRLGRPTRVDYEVLRVGLVRENERHERPYVKGYAFLHAPLWKPSGGQLGFDAGLEIPLGGERLSLLLAGFKRTETNDAWMVSRLENGLFVLMSGDDFLDYWERRGGAAGLRWRAASPLVLTLTLSLQDDVSLEARSIPAVLRSTEVRRPNPAVDDGRRLAAAMSLTLDTRTDETWRTSAWRAGLWFESGIDAGPGEMRYDAFEAELARYTYLPWRLSLDMRGRLFSSFGPVPAQSTRALGGYGGVRGAGDSPFAEARGDRLALVSLELRRRLPEPRRLRSLLARREMLVFLDMGLLDRARRVHAPLDFLDTSFSAWRKTVGVGIAGESFVPHLSLYAAHDLGRDKFEPRLILRFERSF